MPVNHKLNEFKFLLLFFLILTFTCRLVADQFPGCLLPSLHTRVTSLKSPRPTISAEIWCNTTFHFSEISKEHQESGLLISIQPMRHGLVWYLFPKKKQVGQQHSLIVIFQIIHSILFFLAHLWSVNTSH